MPIHPGTELRLSEKDVEKLEGLLGEIVEEYEAAHSKYLNDIDVWWDWYDATPSHAVRNDPWPNASNVVIPFVRIYSDAIQARLFSAMTQSSNFWFGKSQNEQFARDHLRHIVDFLNWGAQGNEYDLFLPLHDWLQEQVVIGSSVAALNWQDRDQWILVPNGTGKPNLRRVRIGRGPVIEHVPREYMLWDPGRSIEESEIVIRQYLSSYSGLVRRTESDGWDEERVEKASKSPGIFKGGGEVFLNKLERGDYSTDGADQLHDIREIHIDWPFLKANKIDVKGEEDFKARNVPIVVTYHPNSCTILRAIPKPYYIPGKPFYDGYFRKRSGQSTSPGTAKMLDHLQRAATTMTNQSIDAIYLANSIVGVTTEPEIIDQIFSPNKWLLATQIGETVPFNMSKVVVPDIAMINLMKTFAESLVGISDPALGRETRLGGHPQPATNFLGSIEQGAILINASLRHARKTWSRVGGDIATLYQQFETNENGKIERALGPADAEPIKEWLFPTDQPIAGNLELDIHALSEVHNPSQERQKAVMVDQVVGNFYQKVLTGLQALGQPEVQGNPIITSAIVKMIEAHGETTKRFLENSDIDETEKFIFDLRETIQSNGPLNQLQQQAGQRAGDVQGVAEGGAVGPPQAGPPGLPGPSNGAAG